MSSDYGPATFISTSHYWKGRSGHTPKWIIVHGTAGGTSATAVSNYFKNNDPPTSTHFVVGLNGEVVQCVSEADSAWGNGIVTKGHDAWWSTKVNPNFSTFSIEHIKPSTSNSSQLTEAQKEASFKLIQHLCEKHNIPKKRADANGGITGHYSVDPVNKGFCPGPYPWDELIAYLNSQEVPTPVATPGVPKGWKDDGKKLTAPNGKQVILGFRWYVLNNKWDAEDWPLENERAASVVDITNPNPKSGTVQYFRKNVLVWEKSTNNMYAAWEKRAESAPKTSNVVMTTPSTYSGGSDGRQGGDGGCDQQ